MPRMNQTKSRKKPAQAAHEFESSPGRLDLLACSSGQSKYSSESRLAFVPHLVFFRSSPPLASYTVTFMPKASEIWMDLLISLSGGETSLCCRFQKPLYFNHLLLQRNFLRTCVLKSCIDTQSFRAAQPDLYQHKIG